MDTDQRPADAAARTIVRSGHLLVGGAALGLAGVMIVAGRAPDAGLGEVFLGLGVLLAVAATVFSYLAVLVLRRAREGGGGSLSLLLSVVELLVGAGLAVGVAVAVQGYGAVEPWRSPLLVPSALLLGLGLAGLLVEGRSERGPAAGTR